MSLLIVELVCSHGVHAINLFIAYVEGLESRSISYCCPDTGFAVCWLATSQHYIRVFLTLEQTSPGVGI